jgi:hypothetical protein
MSPPALLTCPTLIFAIALSFRIRLFLKISPSSSAFDYLRNARLLLRSALWLTSNRPLPQRMSRTSATKTKSLYGVHPGVAMVQKWIGELKEKKWPLTRRVARAVRTISGGQTEKRPATCAQPRRSNQLAEK